MMHLTYNDDGTIYTVATVEHIEHAGVFDGLDWEEGVEIFYGYSIRGGGVEEDSLDRPPAYDYQCWDSEDEALDHGLARLRSLLPSLRQQRKAERSAA